MPDELLSIEVGSLSSIANVIRDKNSSASILRFPAGFVSALQEIETEATVTPKITPQQSVLTPTSTSKSIDAGFHDGTGTVSIQTETGSANPTSTQQTYYPSTGKFFSSFYVGGIGNAYKVASGSITTPRGLGMTINGLNFTPVGVAVILNHNTGNPNDKTIGHGFKYNDMSSVAFTSRWRSTGFALFGTVYFSASFSYGKVEMSGANDIQYFEGTYQYFVWGN